MIEITQLMIEENEAKRKEIDRKLREGEPLGTQEVWMMGDQRQLDDLPNFPECWDMYYGRLYLQFCGEPMPDLKPLSAIHLENLRMFVHNWLYHLDMDYAAGSLGKASQKETVNQLHDLENKWAKNPDVGVDEKDEDLFELLAWSKYRYVLVRKIFELDIKAEYYPLYLKGKEIRFDYESAMHILTRHFAHGMKPYPSIKDHFYGVFWHDHLHKDFENIFAEFDKKGENANNDVKDINFRFKGGIYKIWTLPVDVDDGIFRISTFFPVSSTKILKKLKERYREMEINGELSVFVKA